MTENFMPQKIYLSRPGVVCAAGRSLETLWDSVLDGNQDGIKKTKAISGKDFFAAKVDDSILQSVNWRYDTRLIRMENFALSQIEDGIQAAIERYGKNRVACCVGSCDNGTELSFPAHEKFVLGGSFPENYSLEMQGADLPATFIKEKYGLEGAALSFSTACSSSAVAIIKGAELIQAGLADCVIAGGVDVVSDTVLLGFDSLEAVSSKVTNPFSKNRSGITLGEGAAFFILSKDAFLRPASQASETEAERSPCIKLLGWGESADANHMTSPDAEGLGARSAMEKSIERAGLTPFDISYINLHGTGTKLNDSMEAKAVYALFKDAVPCSTTKPLMGHTLGAAGALELSVCFAAIFFNGTKASGHISNASTPQFSLPPQIWDGERDYELAAIQIIEKNRNAFEKEIRACMSNSFAFGGSNASLIIGL